MALTLAVPGMYIYMIIDKCDEEGRVREIYMRGEDTMCVNLIKCVDSMCGL